jgi:hypothetical protein
MGQNPKIKKIKSKSAIDFGSNVDAAIKKAFYNALLTHKRAGVPVAVLRDGKVVLLQPDEILSEKS